MLAKTKSKAFGKYVYLLGADEDGVYYWLESPTWDCGWYWGFGYIETYTNNQYPHLASDISSHQHADNFLGEYFTEFNGSKPRLKKRTFTDKEGWELSELFETFYTLRKAAELFGRGKSNVADTSVRINMKRAAKRINTIEIPKVTNRILQILSPKNAENCTEVRA